MFACLCVPFCVAVFSARTWLTWWGAGTGPAAMWRRAPWSGRFLRTFLSLPSVFAVRSGLKGKRGLSQLSVSCSLVNVTHS